MNEKKKWNTYDWFIDLGKQENNDNEQCCGLLEAEHSDDIADIEVPIQELSKYGFEFYHLDSREMLTRGADKFISIRSGEHPPPIVTQFPRIPRFPISGEDEITPRVSLGKSVRECIDALQQTREPTIYVTATSKKYFNIPDNSILSCCQELQKKLNSSIKEEGFVIPDKFMESFASIRQHFKHFEPVIASRFFKITQFFETYTFLLKKIIQKIEQSRTTEWPIRTASDVQDLIDLYDEARKTFKNLIEMLEPWSSDKLYSKQIQTLSTMDDIIDSNNFQDRLVPDACETNEYWSLEPIEFYYIGRTINAQVHSVLHMPPKIHSFFESQLSS